MIEVQSESESQRAPCL